MFVECPRRVPEESVHVRLHPLRPGLVDDDVGEREDLQKLPEKERESSLSCFLQEKSRHFSVPSSLVLFVRQPLESLRVQDDQLVEAGQRGPHTHGATEVKN